MRLPGLILRVLAILAALLLASCIDGREEIWLNADGSGRAEITYSLPAAAARFHGGESGVRTMIQDFLNGSPALTDPTCEVATRGDRLTVHVRSAFRSALEFGKLGSPGSLEKLPPSARYLAGEIDLRRDGLQLDFTRTISAGKALTGSLFMPRSQFQGRKLAYIVHLPIAATDSNATRIRDGGKTLEWEFPLEQAVKAPVVTRFSAKIPIPIWAWAVAGGLALVAFAALGFLLRKRLAGSVHRHTCPTRTFRKNLPGKSPALLAASFVAGVGIRDFRRKSLPGCRSITGPPRTRQTHLRALRDSPIQNRPVPQPMS